MTRRPRLLDLFSGAGGAAMGYQRAGFDVVGVDIAPQPHYPFEFHQADALTFPLDGFDAIHASPPCQGYSRTRHHHGTMHELLLEATRQRLLQARIPWVMENVVEAPMPHFLLLCGTQFGLHVYRHRQFEASHLLMAPGPCKHPRRMPEGFVSVYGGRCFGSREPGWGGKGHRDGYGVERAQAAMGIDWMTIGELSQAIPPAYTEYIGRQLLSVLERAA